MNAQYRLINYYPDPTDDDKLCLGALLEAEGRISFIQSRSLTRNLEALSANQLRSIQHALRSLQSATSLHQLPTEIGPQFEPTTPEDLTGDNPHLTVEIKLDKTPPDRLDVPRFWAPRGISPQLSTAGFLAPQPAGSPWKDTTRRLDEEPFSQEAALVLLGEPGMGKTCALDELERRSPLLCRRLNLRDFNHPNSLRAAWREVRSALSTSEHPLLILLDGWDESPLAPAERLELLREGLRAFSPKTTRLRIAARDASWLPEATQLVVDWAGISPEQLSHLLLLPLREEDVRTAALQERIYNPDAFLQAIRTARAGHLAARPVTLRMLLRLFKRNQTLPSSAADLYTQSIREQLIWPPPRPGEAEPATAHAFLPAARVAAAFTLARRDALYLPPPSSTETAPETALYADQITGGQEQDGNITVPVTDTLLRSLVHTPLFSSRGPYLHGFAHKTFQEFLAASYLNTHLNPAQLLNLLTARHDQGAHIPPHLHEVAGWLATLNPDLRAALCEDNPAALLHSDDVAWDDELRAQLVDALTQQVRQLLLPWYSLPHSLLSKLKHPGLGAQLSACLLDPGEAPEVQLFWLRLVEATQLKEAAGACVAFALDATRNYQARCKAARWAAEAGDEEQRSHLKPLLGLTFEEDKDTELRGAALQANWPHNLSEAELHAALTGPYRQNFYGTFRSFVAKVRKTRPDLEHLLPQLQTSPSPRAHTALSSLGYEPETSVPESWTPPLSERIQQLLDLGLSGRPDLFWDLDRHLSINAQGYSDSNGLHSDITQLPGWKQADETTRTRILDLAEQVVVTLEPTSLQGVDLHTYHHTNTSTICAFQLLLDQRPVFIKALPVEIWTTWAEAIMRYGTRALIRHAFKQAPQALTEAALTLLELHATQTTALPLPFLGPLRTLEPLRQALLRELLHGDLPLKVWADLLALLLPLEEEAVEHALNMLPESPAPGAPEDERAHLAAIALRRFDVARFWPHIWAWVERYPAWGRRFLTAIAHTDRQDEDEYGTTSQLTDEAVGQLMLWLYEHVTPETDPQQMYGLITDDKRVRHWRNTLLNIAIDRGCVEALQTLQHLRPQDNLASAIAAARQNRLGRTWQPTSPEELMALVNDSSKRKRVVRTPEDLLGVVVEALELLQAELTGSPAIPPAWPDLWDGQDSTTPSLKKENRISDYITRQLQRMLEGRSIVINREVQVRPGKNANRPEQIDIDAVAQGADGDTLRLFIEVKRSDHKEVKSALEGQLDAYLGGAVQAGLYLVAWADQHATPSMSDAAQLQAHLDAQAEQLQQRRAPIRVRAFVLDCSMPTQATASAS